MVRGVIQQRIPLGLDGSAAVYSVRTTVVWKGNPHEEIVWFESPSSNGTCGVSGLEPGDDVVLLAHSQEGRAGFHLTPWRTTLCSGTGDASRVVGDVVVVAGPGTPVVARDQGAVAPVVAAVAGLGAAALVAGVTGLVLVLRTRRR